MPPPHYHRTPQKVAAHSRIRATLDRMTEDRERNSSIIFSGVSSEYAEIPTADAETMKHEATPPKKVSSNVNTEHGVISQPKTLSPDNSYSSQTPGRVQTTALSESGEAIDSPSARTPSRSNQAQAQSPSRSSIAARPTLLNDRPAPVLELLTQLESGGLSWGDMMMDEDEVLMKQQKAINTVAANSPSLKSSAGIVHSPPQALETQQKIPSISLPPTLSRSAKLDSQSLAQSFAVRTPDISPPPGSVSVLTESATSASTTDADDSSRSNSSNSGTFGFTPSAKFRHLSRKFGIASGSDSIQISESPTSGPVPLFVWQIASQRDRSSAIDLGQRTLLKKLSSPERHRPSAEETARKAEQRQAAAEAKRFSMQEEKRAFLEEQSRRSVNASLRVQEKQDEIAASVQSRIEAAQKRYSEVLRVKVLTAESELLKVKEVSAVQRLESENRKAAMQEHLDNATQRADEVKRLRKTKAGEHVTKVHESLQNLKDSQIAESVQKREELDRKLAEGELRRQNVLSNRKTYGAALTGSRAGVIDLMGSASNPDDISRTSNEMKVSAAAFFAAAAAATVAVGAAPQSIASAAAAASMAAEVANQGSKISPPIVSPTIQTTELSNPVQPVLSSSASPVPTASVDDLNMAVATIPLSQDINSHIPGKDPSPPTVTENSSNLQSLAVTQELLNIVPVAPVSSSQIPNSLPSRNPWKQKISSSFISSIFPATEAKPVDARRTTSSSSSSSSLSSTVSPVVKNVPENTTKTFRASRQRSTQIQQPQKRHGYPAEDIDEQWIEVKTSSSTSRSNTSTNRVGAPLPSAGNITSFQSSFNLSSSITDVKVMSISPLDVPESATRFGSTENFQVSDSVIHFLPDSVAQSARDKLMKTNTAHIPSAALKGTSARRKKLKKLAGSVISSGLSFSQASGFVSLQAKVTSAARSTPPSSAITRAMLALQKANSGALELDATDDWEALNSLQRSTNGSDDDESGPMVATLSSVTPELDSALRDLNRALEGGRSSVVNPLVSPSQSLHLAMLHSTLRDLSSRVDSSYVVAPITSLFRFSDESSSDDMVSLPYTFSDLSAMWNGLAFSLTTKCISKELYVRAPRTVSYALRILSLSIAPPCKGPREWVLAKGVLSAVVDVCTIAAFDTAERLSSASDPVTALSSDDFQANSLLSCLQILWIILQQPTEFSTQSSLVAAETALFQYILSIGLIPQLFSLLKIMLNLPALGSVIETLCISILSFISVALKRPILDSASAADRISFRAIFSSYSRSDLPVYTDALLSALMGCTNNGVEISTLVDLALFIVSSKKDSLQFYLQSLLMVIQSLSWVARLDLKALQHSLSSSEALRKIDLLTNSILDLVQCSPTSSLTTADVKMADYVVHEFVLFIGYAALGNKVIQDCLGKPNNGSSAFCRLLTLPERYIIDEQYSAALFPTLLVLADVHEINRVALKGSQLLPRIITFVDNNQSRLDDMMDAEGPGGLVRNDCAGAATIRASFRLEYRLPPHRWAAAYAFLK
jgi:hypothetical protein